MRTIFWTRPLSQEEEDEDGEEGDDDEDVPPNPEAAECGIRERKEENLTSRIIQWASWQGSWGGEGHQWGRIQLCPLVRIILISHDKR